MAEIALCAAEKLAEYAVDPILNQFKYLFCYTTNIQNLRDELENLENKRIGVQLLVDEATRNDQVVDPEVLAWLQKVDGIKKEADEVLKGTTNTQMQCLSLRCPNLKSRYSMSKKAKEKTDEVLGLQGTGKFDRVGYPKPPVQMPYQTPRDVDGFETRISTKKEILEALKDEDIRIIGICGMPGVGKTTLANEITVLDPSVRNWRRMDEKRYKSKVEGPHCTLSKVEGPHCTLVKVEGSNWRLSKVEGPHCTSLKVEGPNWKLSKVGGPK